MGNMCISKEGDRGDSDYGDKPAKGKSKSGRRVKILLLGAGEAGKSTIAKQMKILHLKGFNESEVQGYRKLVHRNVIDNIRLLIKGAETLDIPLDDPATAQRVMSPDFMADGVLTPEYASEIKKLWQSDNGIREAYTRGTELHMIESTAYYFDSIDRLAQPTYRPSPDDILRARRLTVGAEELEFKIDGYLFHVIDVGGQKGEREKWIDYFQNNDAVIFFVALSEYDQKLAEDNATNRMNESLKLFSDVCNHQWFSEASIILFLNKSDIFREKIQRTPLSVAFPDYKGKNEFEPASEYIKQKFTERINNKKKPIYAYVTCATNTENFKNIFHAVKDIVIGKQMESIGI